MKRIFSNPIAPLAAGFCLRLFFVLKFPANSGDTELYEQIAANWLKHHAYAMAVHGVITPVDLRLPGYPAFLALLYALTGRTGAAARLPVMLVQIGIDLLSCLLVAKLAELLAGAPKGSAPAKRVYFAALWLAALCPFTADYTAVPLTEVFAVFWTGLACCVLVIAFRLEPEPFSSSKHAPPRRGLVFQGLLAGLIVGAGTLFRPETPLLLAVAALVFGAMMLREGNFRRWLMVCLAMALGCAIFLLPWGIRNMITLHEPQFLAPKNSNLPGELVPYGFMAWEKTWLFRMRDCYAVPWKLNEEPIDMEEIPARAFDTREEKERVAAILEQYNEDVTLTSEEDADFAQLARERNARHPFRAYVWLPAARAVVMWFSPRIELLPVSGDVFPLREMRDEDPADQAVTIALFLLNLPYVGLGVWGAARLWRGNAAARAAVAFLALFVLIRTAFLTTVETPEPRYVLVCFPALMAMGAQIFARLSESQPE